MQRVELTEEIPREAVEEEPRIVKLNRIGSKIKDLMELAMKRTSSKKSLGESLLDEIFEQLSPEDPMLIVDVISTEFIHRVVLDPIDSVGLSKDEKALRFREREMVFAILAHPKFDLSGVSLTEEGRDLLDPIVDKAIEMTEKERVKWPLAQAILFIGRLGMDFFYPANRSGYAERAKRALRASRARAEREGWKEIVGRKIPELKKPPFFL